MAPRFSIIIPVYNVALYLRECLDSVLSQTFTDWEAICVDDGSTDGSGAILDEYAAKDKRIRVVHSSNAGVSIARNCALEIVNGDWLTFVDADDWLNCDYLEALYGTCVANGSSVSICRMRRYNDNGYEVFVGPQTSGLYSPEELYVEYNSLCTWSCGKLYKRSLWRNLRFPVGIAYSEDRYILHEILFRYKELPVVAKSLYNYRLRDNSAYGSEWTPKMLQRRFALQRQIKFFSDKQFVKAQYFTAGLYLYWIGMDLIRLASQSSDHGELCVTVYNEFKEVFQKYWSDFVRIRKRCGWELLPSCYSIRCLVGQILSPSGKISVLKRVVFKIKYDRMGLLRRFLLCKAPR